MWTSPASPDEGCLFRPGIAWKVSPQAGRASSPVAERCLLVPVHRNVRRSSCTQEVRLQPRIPVLVGPKGERNRRQIIHQWNGVAVFRQVHSCEKKLAGVAGTRAEVGHLSCNIDRLLAFRFLATRRTMNPPKLPLFGAKRTEQRSFSAVTLRPQHSQKGPRAAQWTNPHSHNHGSLRNLRRAKFGIRLQERPREELRERSDLLVVLASMFPVRFQARDPGI